MAYSLLAGMQVFKASCNVGFIAYAHFTAQRDHIVVRLSGEDERAIILTILAPFLFLTDQFRKTWYARITDAG